MKKTYIEKKMKIFIFLYLIFINYIYKMKKAISYIYKKCWDIIANPNAHVSIHVLNFGDEIMHFLKKVSLLLKKYCLHSDCL